MQCVKIDLMQKKLGCRKGMIKVLLAFADDPGNLAIRSNRRRTPDILSQTNKQAYNKYSSNAQVKLEQENEPESST